MVAKGSGPELPKTFVGSSKEARRRAEELITALQGVTSAIFWSGGAFEPGESTLEGLIRNAGTVDFAVIVMTADDKVEKRRESYRAVRDNVLFEAGLFIGRIGRERTFLVTPRTTKLQLPSDLEGITRVTYGPSSGAGISDAAPQIREAVKRLGHLRLVRQQLVVEVPGSANYRNRRVGIAGTFNKLDAVGSRRDAGYWKPLPMERKNNNSWEIQLTGQPKTAVEYKYVLSPSLGFQHVEVNVDGSDCANRTVVLPQSNSTQQDTVSRWREFS
jgi:hypothetical protein